MNGRADFGVTFNTENPELDEGKGVGDNMEEGDESQDMQVDGPVDWRVVIIFSSG